MRLNITYGALLVPFLAASIPDGPVLTSFTVVVMALEGIVTQICKPVLHSVGLLDLLTSLVAVTRPRQKHFRRKYLGIELHIIH